MDTKRWLYSAARLGLAAGLVLGAQGASPAFRTLYSFQGRQDGASPNSVVFGSNGALYGTTSGGGITPCSSGLNGCGTVFKLQPAKGTKAVLYQFTGQNGDGANPMAGLAIGRSGALYGTTYWGGTAAFGTLFEVRPPGQAGGQWTEAVLYDFGSGGLWPSQPVVIAPNGSLFGTTSWASEQDGLVFEWAPGSLGGESDLFYFDGTNAGSVPSSGLLLGANGVLFGATLYGDYGDCSTNTEGCGTVYQLTPPTAAGGPWTETNVYLFAGPPGDGSGPAGNLSMASDGTLYGTTTSGGAFNYGTVFSLQPPSAAGGAWTETVLYSFTRRNGDGASPNAGVVIGKNGVLYGTTQYGGSALFSGTIFKLTPPAAAGGTWTETILHSFTGENGDGANPSGGLVIGPNGALYGTTMYGGTADAGTVFELTP